MSEIMLHGVLNMPPEIWNNDSPIDVMQRHGRYVQASKYIHELETELAAVTEQRDGLAEECAKIRDVAERAIDYLDQSYRDGFSDEVSELRYELAAVKGGNHES